VAHTEGAGGGCIHGDQGVADADRWGVLVRTAGVRLGDLGGGSLGLEGPHMRQAVERR